MRIPGGPFFMEEMCFRNHDYKFVAICSHQLCVVAAANGPMPVPLSLRLSVQRFEVMMVLVIFCLWLICVKRRTYHTATDTSLRYGSSIFVFKEG